jgi:hypothetical protein
LPDIQPEALKVPSRLPVENGWHVNAHSLDARTPNGRCSSWLFNGQTPSSLGDDVSLPWAYCQASNLVCDTIRADFEEPCRSGSQKEVCPKQRVQRWIAFLDAQQYFARLRP